MTPGVHNMTDLRGRDDTRIVYVGRPTKWGNPFVIGKDGSRSDVVRKYEEWVVKQPELVASLIELRGRDLACWCYPAPCHADVLVRLANDID